jgi:hypothetical protein
MALIIPPLIGNVLLLKLTVDAGWGMIASAWLVSATFHMIQMNADECSANTIRHPALQPSCRRSSP